MNIRLKTKKLEFEGSVIVYDLNYRRIVYQFTLPKESSLYYFSTDKVTSLIATSVHNMPLIQFQDLRKTVETLPVSFNQAGLKVLNFSNLKDIYALQDLLTNTGTRISLQTQFDQVLQNEVSLLLFFEGEKSQLELFIKSLEGQKLKNGKRILIPNKENPYQLTIKDDKNDSGPKMQTP
jgi:hypothetical protein